MNILRWKRKSKKKIKFKTLILFIFSLIMTTFAWFAYSKVIEPTLNIHVASWDIEYYIGETKQTNEIGINMQLLKRYKQILLTILVILMITILSNCNQEVIITSNVTETNQVTSEYIYIDIKFLHIH